MADSAKVNNTDIITITKLLDNTKLTNMTKVVNNTKEVDTPSLNEKIDSGNNLCRIWHGDGGHQKECINQKSANSIGLFLRKRVFCVFPL